MDETEKSAERKDQINGHSTAVEAQKHPLVPSPQIDPILRIQVNKHRALKWCTAEAGARVDALRIEMPENRYTRHTIFQVSGFVSSLGNSTVGGLQMKSLVH